MSAKLMRFVGNYDVNAEGKFLWEILSQMRNFGIGRMVTKNEWGRKWPEQPSYLIIKSVEPEMDRWLSKGTMWADWTYRGRSLGTFQFKNDLNRSDWRLIHVHEEKQFAKCESPMKQVSFSASFPIPPLLQLVSRAKAAKQGADISTVPTRAPLSLCVDPEHKMISSMFTQENKRSESASIYDEVDKEELMQLYGKELPTKVEAWNVGPAAIQTRFPAIDPRLENKPLTASKH